MKSTTLFFAALTLLPACGDETAPNPADSGAVDVAVSSDGSTDITDLPDVGTVPDTKNADIGPVDGFSDSLEDDLATEDNGEPDTLESDLEDGTTDVGVQDTNVDAGTESDTGGPDVVEIDATQPLSLCEQYCILAEQNCVGPNKIDFGPQPCEAQCGTWPEGLPGDTLGNSVQCRLYHLGIAAADPETHCPHAAPDGGDVCVVPDYGNDAGDTCETAGAAVLSPGINTASTQGKSNSYTPGACGFTSGAAKDAAWVLTPPMSGTYTFSLTAEQGGPSVMYVVEDCGDVSGTCLGFSNTLVDEELEANLIAGQTYFVIVEGWNAGQAGPFELEIHPPCVPFCAQFQECGDDGCGGSCGTCNPNDPNGWTTCDPGTNTCVTPQESQANTCSKAIPVYVLPFTFSGSTSGASNNYGYGPSACPGVDFHWGNGSKDHTFVIQPGQSAIYTIELEADFDATLYVVEDCTDIDGTCLAASETFGTEKVELELVAGVQYFVIVDGFANEYDESGNYTLYVGEPCVPSCGDGYCGTDGCGGECFCEGIGETCFENTCCVPLCDGLSCGPMSDGCGGECDCSEGQQCGDEGTCVIAPMGEQCFNPFIISETPFSQAGTTASAKHDHSLPADACGEASPELGLNAPDSVYVFIPPAAGSYTINLTANFEAALYVVKDCSSPDQGCQGFADAPGPKTVLVNLDAGEAVHIIVDGLAEGVNNSGGYVLQISAPCTPKCDNKQCGNDGCGGQCGECGPGGVCTAEQLCEYPEDVGDSCAAPFLIETLPYTNSENTETATNYSSSQAPTCFEVGVASNDHFYAVEAPETGTFLVSVTGLEGFDPVLYARKDCEQVADGLCIDGTIDNGTETLTVDVLSGELWTFVVDGWNNNINEAGPYSIAVDFTANVPQAGEICGEGTPLAAFPVTVSGDTTAASNDYTASLCSAQAFAGGADQVWTLEPPESGSYSISLSGPVTMAYVVSDCAALAECKGFKNFFGDPTPSFVNLEAGTTYYLIVDGYSDQEFGEYSLTVAYEGEAPVAPENPIIINEVDYDQPGADSTEFVELMNPTDASVSAAGLFLVYINGTTGLPYATVPLNELGSIEPGGYAVVGSPDALALVPLGVPTMAGPQSIQNGSPDAIALVAGDPATPGATAWDTFTYEGTIDALADDSQWWVSEGDAGTDNDTGSLGRCPNGIDTDANATDFAYGDVSPGLENPCVEAAEFVAISDQGFTPASLTVSAGTKVVWTNTGAITHTVTSMAGLTDDALTFDPLNSGDIAPGQTFEFTFSEPGIFHYRCAPHAFMTGVVSVE